MKITRTAQKINSYIILVALSIIVIFPYFWMITCAIRDLSDLYTIPPKLWVNRVSLLNFIRVINETRIPVYMLNSLIIACSATLFCLVISIPPGYALARFRFKGKNTLTIGVLLFKLLPQTATLIPLYIMLTKSRFLDTHAGLAFTQQFMMIPFAIWMSRGFIKTLPFSIEEAALIDGCNKLQAIIKVVLPSIGAGVFAVGIYAFMLSWEEFLYAYTFTMEKAKPVSVGLAMFMGEDGTDWGAVMASAVMMSMPILISFFFMQDSFIKGIVGGAIKG